MATRDQIASWIRFQLEDLSARNGHHDFEHLCRDLAIHRISKNILPATGPVSAGGDQGRDFESFRAYASEKSLAFACTLTKSAYLKGKIKEDIEAIVGEGAPVEDIHYFCSANLAVAQRHNLQDWAEKVHNVHLEIYDRQAIADQLLVDRGAFSIAIRYLSIPGEMYPTDPELVPLVTDRKARIFISHSATEKAALAIREALLQALHGAQAYEILPDVGMLQPGEGWRSRINLWLEACDAAIVLLSEAALTSPRVTYETSVLAHRFATWDSSLLILPVVLGDVSPASLKKSYLEPAWLEEKELVRGTPA